MIFHRYLNNRNLFSMTFIVFVCVLIDVMDFAVVTAAALDMVSFAAIVFVVTVVVVVSSASIVF